MNLSENEWLLLNQIVYNIHKTHGDFKLREKLLKDIKFLIPYDKATFYLADDSENSSYVKEPVSFGFEPGALDDYHEKYEKYDYNTWIYSTSQSKVFIMSELLSKEEMESNIYVRDGLRPKNIEYALMLSISYKNKFLGTMSLFRAKESGDFSQRDKYALDILKEHLALKMYREVHGEDEKGKYPAENSTEINAMIEEYSLTGREGEILKMLAYGEDTVYICDALYISESTLRKHISNIYKKLGIGKRNELNKILSLFMQKK